MEKEMKQNESVDLSGIIDDDNRKFSWKEIREAHNKYLAHCIMSLRKIPQPNDEIKKQIVEGIEKLQQGHLFTMKIIKALLFTGELPKTMQPKPAPQAEDQADTKKKED